MHYSKKVSGRIINEVRGINRVTYDVSSKPPQRLSGSKVARFPKFHYTTGFADIKAGSNKASVKPVMSKQSQTSSKSATSLS